MSSAMGRLDHECWRRLVRDGTRTDDAAAGWSTPAACTPRTFSSCPRPASRSMPRLPSTWASRPKQLKKMVTEGVVKIDDVLTTIGSGSSKAFQMTIAGSESASTSMKNQWKIATDKRAHNARRDAGAHDRPVGAHRSHSSARESVTGSGKSPARSGRSRGPLTTGVSRLRSRTSGQRSRDSSRARFRCSGGIMVGLGVAFGAAMVALRPLHERAGRVRRLALGARVGRGGSGYRDRRRCLRRSSVRRSRWHPYRLRSLR